MANDKRYEVFPQNKIFLIIYALPKVRRIMPDKLDKEGLLEYPQLT